MHGLQISSIRTFFFNRCACDAPASSCNFLFFFSFPPLISVPFFGPTLICANKHEMMMLGLRKYKEEKTNNAKKGLKEKTGMTGVCSLLSGGLCKVKLKFTVVMWRSHRHCLLLSPGERWEEKKLPSFDIQIIFKYSNKTLVLCRPFGSLSTTIRSSPPFSSSLCLLCISSPTERVSTLCYFKANAA